MVHPYITPFLVLHVTDLDPFIKISEIEIKAMELLEQGNFDAALAEFQTLKADSELLPYPRGIANALLGIAKIQLEKGDTNRGIANLHEARRHFIAIKVPISASLCSFKLGEMEWLAGNQVVKPECT